MMDVFDSAVLLFESGEDEEGLRVECAVGADGELRIMQESDGPLSEWCFEESPHRIEVSVAPEGVADLLAYFRLDAARQLPAMLRLEYTGYACCQQIRRLMQRLEIPYRVAEPPIVR